MTNKLEGAKQGCCAHLTVKYMTEEMPGGLTRGWWECKDCSTKFIPEALRRLGASEPGPRCPKCGGDNIYIFNHRAVRCHKCGDFEVYSLLDFAQFFPALGASGVVVHDWEIINGVRVRWDEDAKVFVGLYKVYSQGTTKEEAVAAVKSALITLGELTAAMPSQQKEGENGGETTCSGARPTQG